VNERTAATAVFKDSIIVPREGFGEKASVDDRRPATKKARPGNHRIGPLYTEA
jgi:hypothetical protein